MIELINASKRYESGGAVINAVDNITLRVADGDFIAIVGHSGSGKTTLVSLMGGLTKPTSGTVSVGGTDIWTLDNPGLAHLRSEQIGFCFQFASLLPNLTCIDNVRLPGSFAGAGHGGADKAMELLRRLGVADKAKAYPPELSGGQQRRVAIARALINEPGIILADEPTGDLDEDTEADIMDLLSDVNQQGITVVMVTHSSRLAARAGRVLTMVNGAISETRAGTGTS